MPSMLARLGEETRVYHAIADADRLAPLAAPTGLPGYRTYLARIYGFDLPVERACAQLPAVRLRFDLRSHDRPQLLVRDLLKAGYTHEEIAALPLCTEIPRMRDVPEALGWLFVIGRNALLNGLVRRHLARALTTDAWEYLASFEAASALHWRDLGQALDEVCASPDARQRTIDAAILGFQVQHRWLHFDS